MIDERFIIVAWHIYISVEKYFKDIIVSLVDIAYSRVLLKILLTKNVLFFFTKLLVQQPPAIYHQHPLGTCLTPSVPRRYQSLLFTKLCENIDTLLVTWPFNRPYPRTRLFWIVLLCRGVHNPQDPVHLPGMIHGLSKTVCEHQTTSPDFPLCSS